MFLSKGSQDFLFAIQFLGWEDLFDMKAQLFLSLAGRDSAIQCLDEKIFLTSGTDFRLSSKAQGLVAFLILL